jgi:hypothetical protein
MKSLLILLSLLFINPGVYSQDIRQHISEMDRLISVVPNHIGNKEHCDKLVRDLDDLSDDIEDNIKKDDDLSSDDIKNLKAILASAEAVEDFVRAVGNSSYGTGFLKEKQLRLVRELLNFSMTEMFTGKFCVNIYQVTIGGYKSLIVTKTGSNNILRIKAVFKSTVATATTTLEMGVVPNEYSRFWSSANDPSYRSYQITRVDCAAGSNNGFNF